MAARVALGFEIVQTVSTNDCAETFRNPGCGPAETIASSFWAPLVPGMDTSGLALCADALNCSALWDLGAYSKGYLHTNANGVSLLDHYEYVTNHVGGADIPLDENALLAVSNSLLRCRLNGGTCIPRFAYTGTQWIGCEPDDFEMILTHVRQLAAVVSQFRDVVPAVECGMIGPWGEMHDSRYRDGENDEYPVRVVQTWLDGLPQDMAVLVRYPRVWTHLLDTTTGALFAPGGLDAIDQTLRQRMGFFNDGYLGSDSDYGTWRTGDNFWWNRQQGCDFLRGQAVPYGGELATISDAFFDEHVHLLDPATTNIVEEWYDTHLSYLRNISHNKYVINQKMKSTAFSSEKWSFNGMPDLHEYEGLDLHKFCEDHMGYRYVVRSVGASESGGAALDVEIENTGFGQLLFDERLEILLVPETGPEFSVRCPTTVSGTLASLRGGDRRRYTITFDIPPQIATGRYMAYLRASAPLADEADNAPLPRRAIRFANQDCWNATLKANYLCDIIVDAWTDLGTDNLWFAYGENSGRTIGGHWSNLEQGAYGLWSRRDFAIDEPLPSGDSGTVEIGMEVGALPELPDNGPSAANFLFIHDGASGLPKPYCHTAKGWTPLHGRDFEEGEWIILKITLDSGHAAYEVDGLPLLDSSGHKFLHSSGRTLGTSTLLLLGGGIVSGFRGRHSRGLFVPTVFQGN
ncbi:MAG: DUF4832 domain-containing protein [Kiritimatiellae bacterium]|nr:DUF4832 domain-containing protein [Kiritimatiellia bacterium]